MFTIFTIGSLLLTASISNINAKRPLPFNPNLAENTSDPIHSLQSKIHHGRENENILTMNIYEKDSEFTPNPGNPAAARKLATEYALRIHKKPFTQYYTEEIEEIYNTQKFTTTYAAALPTIIKLSFSRIEMWSPNSMRYAQVGIRNFHKFMDILHIEPMTVQEMEDPEFLKLDGILQLMIWSSRAIVHQFAFTDIWDRRKEYYWSEIGEPSIELYPWLDEQQTDKDCILDVMKIIYWHSYDFLSTMIRTRLPPLDALWGFTSPKHEYVEELIKKWGFIPWKRDVVEKMIKLRDFEEFSECYAVGTNIIFDSFFDDDEVKGLEHFYASFEMDKDYDKVMVASCDDVCEEK